MKYLERWAVTRQAGFLMIFLLNAFRAFVAVMFIQVLYQLSQRNFQFQVGLLQIGLALIISLAIWFGSEFLYNKKAGK
jgi:hypothetical protein